MPRDPRVDPVHGDLLEWHGEDHEVSLRKGKWVYWSRGQFDSGSYRSSINSWRKNAKSATVLKLGDAS